MMKAIELPYGQGHITIEVPESNLAWIVSPKNTPGVADPAEEVKKALQFPVGGKLLEELVREKGDNVVILVDDMTRSTPQKVILPVLLDELNKAGVKDEKITALIALGTHRPMSEAEILGKFGAEAVGRIRFINHDCKNREGLIDVKNPNSATPILVNRIYYESDISIAVGNIIPHMYAGWAGGCKMVQPGVCGEATTGETHYMASEDVHGILGNVDNKVRREIENVARLTGLTMIVNTVLNLQHEIVRVVAGDPVAAHRVGVKAAEEVYRVEIDDYCDIVIASAYPADLDFWQSIKALNNCALAVRPGGTLILLADDPEGIAPDHPDLVRLGTASPEEAKKAYYNREIKDKVALATYLAMDLNRRRVNVVLISRGISSDHAFRIGMKTAPDAGIAISDAMDRVGDKATIGVVTHGADIYFMIKRGGEAGPKS